jgi:hypothetical protein
VTARSETIRQRRIASADRGDCTSCFKLPAEPKSKKCRRCRENHRKAQRTYEQTKRRGLRLPVRNAQWCDECLACGFHRGDCPTFRTVHP